jgi:hypothetical protein
MPSGGIFNHYMDLTMGVTSPIYNILPFLKKESTGPKIRTGELKPVIRGEAPIIVRLADGTVYPMLGHCLCAIILSFTGTPQQLNFS